MVVQIYCPFCGYTGRPRGKALACPKCGNIWNHVEHIPPEKEKPRLLTPKTDEQQEAERRHRDNKKSIEDYIYDDYPYIGYWDGI